MKLFIPCIICAKKADWAYMPGRENYCDNCVPRGCSCNRELKDGIDYNSEEATLSESYVEKLDDKGRRLPCVEFWEIREESHNDKDRVDAGWEVYYEMYPEKRRESDEIEHWEKKLGVD